MVQILDLQFLALDHAIAAFIIPTKEGPILVETGPYSTYPQLKTAIASVGFEVGDIKHVFLTHIHFDHAGAAWAFAKTGARIYVHPFGAPHLASPGKLYESARMIYGDQMNRLWGAMESIDPSQIHETNHLETINIGGLEIKALHTPGHAKHHIAWQIGDALFTGDVAGVKIEKGPVVPPCPPPDINLEDWYDSINLILDQNVDKYYLTHFGTINNLQQHMDQLRHMLSDWSQFVLKKWQNGLTAEEITPLFTDYTKAQLLDLGVSEHGTNQYEAANPSWMSVTGLIRYWKKNLNK
jgi:glyoxylase-like metal-dependent hydrolase (beta-lactamase superfamily II)